MFREGTESSLLHVFFESYPFSQTRHEDIISCIKLLLSAGIDPTLQCYNTLLPNSGSTALDHLFSRFFYFRAPFLVSEIPGYLKRIQCLQDCFQILKPWFKGSPRGDVIIPQLKPNYTSIEEFSKDLVQLWYVIINIDVDINPKLKVNLGERRISGMVGVLEYDSLCEPAVELLYSAMRKGYGWLTPCTCQYNLPVPCLIIDGINRAARQGILHCTCYKKRPAHVPKPHCTCCNWALPELVLNSKPGELHVHPQVELEFSIQHQIYVYVDLVIRFGDSCPTENISKVVNILWMYVPSSKSFALDTLEKLMHKFGEQKVMQELQELMLCVRPLKLLTRLCILQNMDWMHIQRLPLPASLIRYIEIGNISSNHVIHRLI